MKTIRRPAGEVIPAILQCYNGASPTRIRFRVIYNAKGYHKLCTSDFSSRQDANNLISWLELHGFTASLTTVIDSRA